MHIDFVGAFNELRSVKCNSSVLPLINFIRIYPKPYAFRLIQMDFNLS